MPETLPRTLIVLESPQSMRAWREGLPPTTRVGFVPTMGALHEGHARLLRELSPRVDRLVLSIFVNPTQFGPNEDLAKYPRTLEADLAIARAEGVDAVFLPAAQDMYPPGASTFVEETSLSQPLCGPYRPGHFRGVATVVLKLLNLVRPRVALFGIKDAQQFFIVSRMARDLNLDVSIEAMPTVREPDGLALSSRNRYLSPEERKRAARLPDILRETAEQIQNGALLEETLEKGRMNLKEAGFSVQYLQALTVPDLAPIPGLRLPHGHPALVAVAAYLGSTRLIDNWVLNDEAIFKRESSLSSDSISTCASDRYHSG
jgi:pantoate--beta-alanine ligase